MACREKTNTLCMEARTQKIVAAGAAIILVVGVGAVALGLGPFGGGANGESDGGFGGLGGGDGGDSDGSGDGSSAKSAQTNLTSTNASFAFDIKQIKKCGSRCRNVTATLMNNGTAAAESVNVTTVVYTDGDRIWKGDAKVGLLEVNETYTSTRKITVSYTEAMKIKNNGGYITIRTVVRSANGTKVFEDRRKVA